MRLVLALLLAATPAVTPAAAQSAFEWSRTFRTDGSGVNLYDAAPTPGGGVVLALDAPLPLDLDQDGETDLFGRGRIAFGADGAFLGAARLSGGTVTRVAPRAIAGGHGSAVDLDGDGTADVAAPAGEFAGFVSRLAPDGSVVWAHALDGEPAAASVSVAALRELGPDLVVSGVSARALDLDGDGVAELPGHPLDDGFVARYSADGTLAWSRVLQSQGTVRVVGLSASDAGVVVAGKGVGESDHGIDFDGDGIQDLTFGDLTFVFVARYTADGEFVGVRTFPRSWGLNGFAATPDGEVMIALGYPESPAADLDGDGEPDVTPADLETAVLARFAVPGPDDVLGPIQWATTAGRRSDLSFRIAPVGTSTLVSVVLDGVPLTVGGETVLEVWFKDDAAALVQFDASGAIEGARLVQSTSDGDRIDRLLGAVDGGVFVFGHTSGYLALGGDDGPGTGGLGPQSAFVARFGALGVPTDAPPAASERLAGMPRPNPSGGAARLDLAPGAACDVRVLDVLGREVARQTAAPSASPRTVQLPAGLPSGVYTVRLSDGTRVESVRWTVAR